LTESSQNERKECEAFVGWWSIKPENDSTVQVRQILIWVSQKPLFY
jgi:hypothetical protein